MAASAVGSCGVTEALASLVMSKRKLPSVLCNDVPPLRIARAPAQFFIASGIAIRKNRWRVLRADIGKEIRHRGRSVLIVDDHANLRQVVDESGSCFWVPKRVRSKRALRKERIARQFAQGVRNVFSQPHWTGEPRPKNARRVLVRSNFPSPDYLRHLVAELGYNGHAAYAAVVRGHLPFLFLDGHATEDGEEQQRVGQHTEHPFIPASPTQRLKRGGGFRKEQVTAAIEKHRWDEAHATAVFEVVYLRRKPFFVAASLRLKLTTIYQYASRVRADLRREPAPKEKADLHAKRPKSLVFSECV